MPDRTGNACALMQAARSWRRSLTILALASGCGLTQAQLKGIDEFGKAATGYSKVPDAAFQAYRDFHRAATVLSVSTSQVRTADDAQAALGRIRKVVEDDALKKKA